jgi:hypothetical protein
VCAECARPAPLCNPGTSKRTRPTVWISRDWRVGALLGPAQGRQSVGGSENCSTRYTHRPVSVPCVEPCKICRTMIPMAMRRVSAIVCHLCRGMARRVAVRLGHAARLRVRKSTAVRRPSLRTVTAKHVTCGSSSGTLCEYRSPETHAARTR